MSFALTPTEPQRGGPHAGDLRLRLDLSYDGTNFSGWALQPGRRTVQDEVTRAVGTVLRLDPPPRVQVAGRTDTGVHATGQVAHVDVPAPAWSALTARPTPPVRRLAGVLPPDVRIQGVAPAPPHFDARFGAIWRRYRYRLCDAPGGGSPLRRLDTADHPRSLDDTAMDAAAAGLVGLHDFAAFCRAREGATTVRDLQQCTVQRSGDLVEVHVRADAFCHSMVRSLVGALLAVGEGRRPVEWPSSLLDLRERTPDITVAPAKGLTLLEVGYPPPEEYAARAEQTRALRDAV
ncbi:tRNA pseudouridine(38-40) synthase TruA [Jatrophihabitans sp. YIM 134969]